jgi:hypothetical protein
MGADLAAAASIVAVAVVGVLVTLVCWRRARLSQQVAEQERQERLTANAVAAVRRGDAEWLSKEARALARAWFLEQFVRSGDVSDLQRVSELQEREG